MMHIAPQSSVRRPPSRRAPFELAGLDGFTALGFKAGALAKLLAGGPCVAARLFGASGGFPDGRLHEYGSTLMMMAGLFNVLGVSSALDLRKEQRP